MNNAPQRILVTGGSGFVGSAVIGELLARNYDVTALIRHGHVRPGQERVKTVRGDILQLGVLEEAMSDCAAVIHLVGIIMEKPADGVTFERIHVEGAKNVIAAAQRAGVRRFIHMSALGARADAVSHYHKTKFEAEQALRANKLDWTIFEPSLIHGKDGEFMKMEAGWARGKRPPFFFMPYFGAGLLGLGPAKSIQPVFVKDVARAFVDALEKPHSSGQTYPLGGRQQLTWPAMHQAASKILAGHQKPAIPIPAWYARLLTSIVPAKFLPFSRDQVIMAQEDNTCDIKKFTADFGWEPGGFEETLRTYAGEIGR